MDSTETIITVNGLNVQIVRKSIKNLHLAVYPPDGHVRVAAPEHVSDDNVRLAVVNKLKWIKTQQQDFKDQPRQSERQYISGECHYFFGKKYRFELVHKTGKPEVEFLKSGRLKLLIKPDATIDKKEQVITEWYRQELKKVIPELLQKWQPIVGKQVNDWGIKKMKTKWGSCNIEQKRIWLNLELAKKPMDCLEYILVHELIHLHERNHNERFKSMLDNLMPDWKSRRDMLNRSPLAHEDWDY